MNNVQNSQKLSYPYIGGGVWVVIRGVTGSQWGVWESPP